MNRSRATVAVDVGNTAVKLAVELSPHTAGDHAACRQRNFESLPSRSFSLDHRQWPDRLVQWIKTEVQVEDAIWRISSVQRQAVERLRQQVAQSFPDAHVDQITRDHLPMPIDVDVPETVGIDRLLGAFAAINRFDGPVIIVDAGSAVTVDYVDDRGHFAGGAILPGLNLQTHALATGTDALPPIDWTRNPPLRVPAKNTTEAIQLGVLTSVTSAIDRLIDWYNRHPNRGQNGEAIVVLCGGDAAAISARVERQHVVHHGLVCQGIFDLSLPPRREMLR
ncbi:type III pantothenate kinase [Novipirellula artificiosorum]|uniref:Type III pantothenate kinase n=1 Tax=Novipirellula artificiosorum TaxID=2528016 RepID=A0A5C6DD72_9BACT|nr:type III pantothenate kinase [Novipirellula artificiosorum]TWU33717.1 Type III pantothenate kinase [Novipirellula artificiosorum]